MSDMDEYHRKRAQMRHEEDRNAKKIFLKGLLGGTSTALVSAGMCLWYCLLVKLTLAHNTC